MEDKRFSSTPGHGYRGNNLGRHQIYENVDLFKEDEDPFGEDFEAALQQGIRIRIKQASCSSFDSINEATNTVTPPTSTTPSSLATPPFSQTPTQNYESPPIPVKKCSRSISVISRQSFESGDSDRTQTTKLPSSYDQVSISSNFNKPILHESPGEKVYDVFSNISFSSPLRTQEDGTSEEGRGFQEERSMNSLESDISSINICEKPAVDETEYEEADDPYENIDEIRHSLRTVSVTAPDPPPRNSVLKPAKPNEIKPEATENLYSEQQCTVGGDNQHQDKNKDSLFDRLMNEPASSLDPAVVSSSLGAKPKSSRTIDIRSKVHQWYEEAAQEVERDLSLDVKQLEKNGLMMKRVSRKPSYEYVCLARTGRMEGDEPLPKPTGTLLRDFDPCYDESDEDRLDAVVDHVVQEEEEPEQRAGAVTRVARDPEPPEEDNSNSSSSVTKPSDVNGVKSDSSHSDVRKFLPRKFPLGSPKKINFGPPKPPRSYDYSSGGKLLKKEKKAKSGKPVKENVADSVNGEEATGGKNGVDPLKGEVKEDQGRREENLYVDLPPSREENIYTDPLPSPDTRVSPASKRSSMSSSVSPKSSTATPPPPLPASLPPSASKPKQTMYENVWIERESPVLQGRTTETSSSSIDKLEDSPPLPVVPPRGDKPFKGRPRREGKTEHGGKLRHKSDSIGSESSVTTTDSSNSKDQVEAETKIEKKKLKKVASGRSFSVASIKLGKLPGIADNIKRRMSDQIKPVSQGTKSSPSLGDTLEDSDDEELSSAVCDINTFPTRRSSMITLDPKSGSKNHSGAIFVFSRRKKQFYCKWCVLGEGFIKWFNEETSLARPKETVMLNNIFTVTKKSEKNVGPSQQDLYCIDLAALNSKGKFVVFTFGCASSGEREVWMEKLVQSLGTRLSNFSTVGCKRIGWAYLKAGFAAEWSLSWIYLVDRHIVYATEDSRDFEKIDLKKTKDVFIRKDSKNLCLPTGFTKHPVLVCDFNDRSLYILLGAVDEVAVWRSHIEQIAFTNNNVLGDQQVTHENVPVIVDKCVKFVFSHGVMTEGIYRLAGVNTKINKLLSEFRSNAWAVQISRENYSEHDVANVLKRFIRQLEEPLLTDYLKEGFLKATVIQDQDCKLKRYKNLLKQLPGINYSTIRKLLGHLHTVAEQCDKNLMPVYNLAPLWGPNILIVDSQEQDFGETSRETEVCGDLITNYPYLFDVDMEELDKERRLLDVLEKINYPTPSTVKRSGDVRMWCYIESRTAGKCVSISLHPSLTAGEAIRLVAKEAQLTNIQDLFIHEVVLGETLERPVHYSEKMLDLTLRWGAWEDEDRRNNYLVVKENSLYSDALPCAVPPLSIFSEIQFSDNKPKSKFTKFFYSVSNASITLYKEDKNGQKTESNAWPVEEIIWYIGCEKKRNTPFPLNLTFISKQDPVRSKETPLFGRTLSFGSRELFTKSLAALLVAEYGTNIVQNNLVMLD